MDWTYNRPTVKSGQQQMEDRGYKLEFEYGEWGYEWSITEVWTKDGRVFALRDSGCSCYGFADGWDNIDVAIGELMEVTRLPSLDEIKDEHYYHSTPVGTVQEKYRALGLR